MDAIFKTVKDSTDVAVKMGDNQIADTDVWRDVGGVREQDQFNMRLLALTKPAEYAGLKAQALEGVKSATESSYEVSLKQHLAAGVSLDDAKKAITKSILKAQDCETMIAFSISDAFCVNRFRDEFYHIVNNSADIIFANELEIKSLFSTDKLEEAINKCQEIGKIFAITLGDKGAKLVHGKIIIDVQAEEIENLVDTTGAGDLFAAGFLAEYIKSQDLYRCLNRGVKMSSIIIQKFGARI